jgi:hypothetical protein
MKDDNRTDSDKISPSKEGSSQSAALQLLQLAGTKRPRRDVTSTTTSTTNMTNTTAQDGQFDDATSEEDETSEKRGKVSTKTNTASMNAAQFDPDFGGGQFSDADEVEEHNIHIPWSISSAQQPNPISIPVVAVQPPPPHNPTYAPAATSQLPLLAPLPPGVPRNFGRSLPFPPLGTFSVQSVQQSRETRRTLADGPISQHPSPILEPDSDIPHTERLPTVPVIQADTERRTFPVYQPLSTDILLGRGGGPNRHAGNLWFRDFIQAYRATYHRVDKYMKKQLAINLVQYIRHCGGRFLEKKTLGGGISVWYDVGDGRARSKCSQALREPSEMKSTSSTASKSASTTSQKKAPKVTAATATATATAAGGTGGITAHSEANQKREATHERRPSASSTITSQHSYEALDDNDNSSLTLEI